MIMGYLSDGVSLSPFMVCGMDFPQLTIAMLIYSFTGWIYESTVYSIAEQGKLMNRGCFIGPYCPIYAVVSILNLYLLRGIESPVKIMIVSSLTVCAVEYITSWVLEKVFNARYWDYSSYPLNINGRISVPSGVFFGLAILFLVKLYHPAVVRFMAQIPPEVRYYASIAIWVVFLSDAVFTTISMCNLNKKCKEIYDAIDKYSEQQLDKINSKAGKLKKFRMVRRGQKLVVMAKGVNKKIVEVEAHYLMAVKDFQSTRYPGMIDQMRRVLSRKAGDTFDELSDDDIDDGIVPDTEESEESAG